MKKENLRLEKLPSISASVPTQLADNNGSRWKLRIRTSSLNGIYVGLDDGVVAETAFFLPQNNELRVEKYKGPIWALSCAGVADVYIYEESYAEK